MPATMSYDRTITAEMAIASTVKGMLDADGPWPSRAEIRTHPVAALDVDHFHRFAVVACVTEGKTDGYQLREDVFVLSGDENLFLYGCRSDLGSDPFVQRFAGVDRSALVVRSRGRGLLRSEDVRVSHAVVSTSSDVSEVLIARGANLRSADVSSGPGWIAVVWPKGDEPRIAGFDARGEELSTIRLS